MKAYRQTQFAITLLLFLAGSITAQSAFAQSRYTLTKANQEFTVKGTSSLHDWHMKGSEGLGECLVAENEDGTFKISEGKVKFPAESLKSGKGGMDRNAYKALKTDDYSWIEFSLTQFKPEANNKAMVTGKLTLAGFTKEVSFEVTAIKSGHKIQLTGTTAQQLTAFKIDPPTALMGTIKTGDEITIEFNATFENLNQ